jgi:hypothetical protein
MCTVWKAVEGRKDGVVNILKLWMFAWRIEAMKFKCYLRVVGEMREGWKYLAVVFDVGVVGEGVEVRISRW